MIENVNFGTAVEAAKKGKLIARQGWNGKGMFVFQTLGEEIPILLLLSANSIPKGVKDFYERLFAPMYTSEPIPSIKNTSFLCMKTADNTLVNGWLASQTDILSDDWIIYEYSSELTINK